MSDYASVLSFGKRMESDLSRLDGLEANAGISTNKYSAAEGIESTLTVNVVSTFLLAVLALPQLERTANGTGIPTHLTIVGSNVHCFAAHDQLEKPVQREIFDTLSDKAHADMAARYFLSKLMVMQCTCEFPQHVPKARVIVNCPSPGWCKTELFR